MHYLIDGYNLFFAIENKILPLEAKRDNFICALNQEIAIADLNATLIFDGNKQNSGVFPSKQELSALDVTFSPEGLSADDYILELLTSCPNPKMEIVVTSDRELSKKSTFLGAKTKTIESFLKFLLKKKSKKQKAKQEEKQELKETHYNLERLVEIFEERLDK